MRTLKRNHSGFSYCLLLSASAPVVDENGNRTGSKIPLYGEPVAMRANVSPASGFAQTEQFGDLTDYDKVIVTEDVSCPITESTVLFVDKSVEFSDESYRVLEESETVLGDGEVILEDYQIPLYDYIVRRVSKSINSVSIAISKVKVR